MHRRILIRSLELALGTLLCLSRSAAAGTPAGLVAYAEQDFEYVRFDLFAGSPVDIGPLTQSMRIGAFANYDFSREYAIDYPGNNLYSIDVDTATTTLIGTTGVGDVPSGLVWNTSGFMELITHDLACGGTSLYALDVTTGEAKVIGVEDGCLEGLAIDAVGDTYSIDIASGNLVELGVGVVGPLGFDFTSVSALFIDPSTGILYLIAADGSGAGANSIYAVDTETGAAMLIAPFGLDPISAFAVAPADTGTIFSNGFDPSSLFP